MTDADIEYYERRARQEAEAAASSTKAETASAHRLLAIEYEAHPRDLRKGQHPRPKLTLRIS